MGLVPPSFEQAWHIGIEDTATKELVCFVADVPAKLKMFKHAKVRLFKKDLELKINNVNTGK